MFKRRFTTDLRRDRCHSERNQVGFRRVFKLIPKRDYWRRRVPVEQLCSHSTKFHEIFYWDFFFFY